jgi:Zn-dependent protease with chaperone function
VGIITKFIKAVLRSRWGQVLFAAHLALAVCAYILHRATPAPYLDEEPILVQILFWANYPALIAASWLTSPLLPSGTDEYQWQHWVAVIFVVSCALLQWWLIGYLIERFWGVLKIPSSSDI